MANCWERRGCDEEMMSRCPHNTPGEPCPADCHYAACDRPTHVVATDFAVLLNPERYYDAAVKEVCRFCEHFLEHGPDIADARPPTVYSVPPMVATAFVRNPMWNWVPTVLMIVPISSEQNSPCAMALSASMP